MDPGKKLFVPSGCVEISRNIQFHTYIIHCIYKTWVRHYEYVIVPPYKDPRAKRFKLEYVIMLTKQNSQIRILRSRITEESQIRTRTQRKSPQKRVTFNNQLLLYHCQFGRTGN